MTRTRLAVIARPDGTLDRVPALVSDDGTVLPLDAEHLGLVEPEAFRTLTPKRRVRPAGKKDGAAVVGRVTLNERELARFRRAS